MAICSECKATFEPAQRTQRTCSAECSSTRKKRVTEDKKARLVEENNQLKEQMAELKQAMIAAARECEQGANDHMAAPSNCEQAYDVLIEALEGVE